MEGSPVPPYFDEQLRAFAHHASLRSASIVDLNPDPLRASFGAGTILRIRARLFVATAAHMILSPLSELLVSGKDASNSTVPLKPISKGVVGGGDDDADDLGWIEVEDDPAIQVVDLTRLRSSRGGEGRAVTVVVGTPAHRTHGETSFAQSPLLEVRHTWNVQLLTWATNALPLDRWPNDLPSRIKPESYMLLEYGTVHDVGADGAAKLIEPGGMSGGGIWRLPVEGSGDLVWEPGAAELIGIQTSFFRGSSVLCGHRIKAWVSRFVAAHPELADNFAPDVAR